MSTSGSLFLSICVVYSQSTNFNVLHVFFVSWSADWIMCPSFQYFLPCTTIQTNGKRCMVRSSVPCCWAVSIHSTVSISIPLMDLHLYRVRLLASEIYHSVIYTVQHTTWHNTSLGLGHFLFPTICCWSSSTSFSSFSSSSSTFLPLLFSASELVLLLYSLYAVHS